MKGTPPPSPRPRPVEKPLMRSLGEFFGEVWKGVKADPSGAKVVRKQTREATATTPDGRALILRRTTVDEVIVPERMHRGGAEHAAKKTG